MVISANKRNWSMTGWEMVAEGVDVEPRAYQQSWILIPGDFQDLEESRRLEMLAEHERQRAAATKAGAS